MDRWQTKKLVRSQLRPRPTAVYKYRAIRPKYADDDIKRICEILDGSLYAAHRAALNDPFDCLPLLWPNDDEDAVERWIRLQTISLSGDELLAANDGYRQIYKWQRFDDEFKDFAARRWMQATYDNVGIVALSERYDNPLLWSHYASAHTGVCIGLDAQLLARLDSKRLFQVYYSAKRPEISVPDVLTHRKPPSRLIEAFLIKPDSWAYEQEWRLICEGCVSATFAFPPTAVKSIHYGTGIAREHLDQINDHVINLGHPVLEFKASLSDLGYGLEFEQWTYSNEGERFG